VKDLKGRDKEKRKRIKKSGERKGKEEINNRRN